MAFVDSPTEQTTAFTDAVLALLVIACLVHFRRAGTADAWKARLWSWVFCLLAVGAALGAVSHGVEMPETTWRLLWHPINLSLGLTVSLFVVAVLYDMRGRATAARALPFMIAAGAVFYGITVPFADAFPVFIVYATLATVSAFAAYVWIALRRQVGGAWWMAAGVFVTIVASAVQACRLVSFTLIWEFDHNGVYHLIQMAGVVLLTRGVREGLLRAGEARPHTR